MIKRVWIGSMTRVVTGLVVALVTSTALGLVSAQATAPGENGRIAFRRYFNADQSLGAIFTINPNGTGVRQITHRGKVALDTIPDWSPDGRWIAFQRQVEGKATAIFKVRSDGTHLTRLSTDPNVNEELPAWSPTGNRIAFTRFDDATGVVAVFVMRADGTQVRQVTPSRFGGAGGQFSPNGTHLVFGGSQSGTSKLAIFTIRLDGTDPHRLTPWKMHAGGVDWSPNGRWIKFRSHVGQDRTSNLYLIHPDGTGLVRITDTFSGFPQWGGSSFSPDGTMITAAHNISHEGRGSVSHVWVVDLDGSNLRRVTRSPMFDSAPDWGPRPA